MTSVLQTLVAFLMCWFVATSLWIYPHSLSYFNESIGGPLNGGEHLLGSNVDWGQDLRYLSDRFSRHEGRVQNHLVQFRYSDPNVVGVRCDWIRSGEIQVDSLRDQREPRVFNVSVNELEDFRRWFLNVGPNCSCPEDVSPLYTIKVFGDVP